jgi:diguanylate cyclase (GGDEF)-like protein
MPHPRTRKRAARFIPPIALLLAIALLSIAVGAAAAEHGRKRDSLDRALAAEAREQAAALDDYFRRARSLTLVTANNPAYRQFYELPGSRVERIRESGSTVREAQQGLSYLETLFPGSIGEACFIDAGGAENARAVRGVIEPMSKLSPDETGASFFEPTFDLDAGEVYQARPYLSPDTSEWVISNSTPVPDRLKGARGIIHFEFTIESFRRAAADTSDRFDVAVIEARDGRVIADSRYRQRAGEDVPLGRPGDRRFARFFSTAGKAFRHGSATIGGLPSAFKALDTQPHNPNRWIVVATARTPGSSWLGALGLAELSMIALALVLLGFAVLSLRASHAQLSAAALTDSLTGLPNRRQLIEQLEQLVPRATAERPLLLGLFDLDGFKAYNDAYGHPAGDALLVRLAAQLDAVVKGWDCSSAYRMGGDEFCVLALTDPGVEDELLEAVSAALYAHGEGFEIAASHGSILVPVDAVTPKDALRLADQRMYSNKNDGRASAGRQTTDALGRVLAERYPDIGEHLDGVTELCALMADALELPDDERSALLQAASLHDIGKAAVPDAILSKEGPLSDEEWAFMRRHTVIGERILSAAPALARASQLVRWSHERYDGGGYPDGLQGQEIPLGARIIAVCDAFDAMSSSRPYRRTPMSREGAIAELRRCAGGQFDPYVVQVFCRVLGAQPLAASGRSL